MVCGSGKGISKQRKGMWSITHILRNLLRGLARDSISGKTPMTGGERQSCRRILEGMGFTVVPFGQGFASMSPPTKELMRLALEQRIAHGGHLVLRWNMDNIYIRTELAGNIKVDKAKSTVKIDGAVVMIMALDRAIRCGNKKEESVYNSRGLIIL